MTNTIFHKQQQETLEQGHIEKLKQRYADEDLSALELQVRFQELAEDSSSEEISNGARQLLRLEMKLVSDMIHEGEMPIPSPQETFENLQHTNPLAAEALQHQMDLEAKKEAVATAQVDLNEASQQGWAHHSHGYKTRLEALDTAKQALNEAMLTPPPKFARDAEHSALTKGAADLHVAADNLGEQSPDSSLARIQAAMNEEAQQMIDKAEAVRGHIPVFDSPAA